MFNIRNFSAGSTSAFVILPRNLAFGILIFSPLGASGIVLGATAGLMSAVISNLVAGLIKRQHLMPLSTFSLSALLLMEMNHQLLERLAHLGVSNDLEPYVLLTSCIACLIAGITKAMIGVFKLGNLSRFISRPVLVGVLNGAALLIFVLQLERIFVAQNLHEFLLQSCDDPINVVVLCFVAIATAVAMTLGKTGATSRIPSPLLGLATGVLAFYIAQHTLTHASTAPMVGALPHSLPLSLPGQLYNLPDEFDLSLLTLTIFFGIAIGFADAIRATLSVLLTNSITEKKININEELIANGVGSLVSAFAGAGLTSTGNATAASSAHKESADSTDARVTASIFILSIWYLTGDYFEFVPIAVVAAIIIVLTASTLNLDYLKQARKFIYLGETPPPTLLTDLCLSLLMTLLVMVSNLISALFIGIILSCLIFVIRSASSPIRSIDNLGTFPSASWLPSAEQDVCNMHHDKVVILSLSGPIFFGSVDLVSDAVSQAIDNDAEVVILETSRVTEIDSTAANTILGLARHAGAKNRTIVMAPFDIENSELILAEDISNHDKFALSAHDNIEAALEQSRDIILTKYGYRRNTADTELTLHDVDCLLSLRTDQVELLDSYCTKREFRKGDILIPEGSHEQVLMFLTRGRVSIFKKKGVQDEAFAFLGAGCTVGDMSFLTRKPASASVRADCDTLIYVLCEHKMASMKREQPELLHAIVLGLAKVFADRMRTMNKIAFGRS